MYIADFFASIHRQKINVIILFIFFFATFFTGSLLLPQMEKTTVYFSLKPITTADQDGTFVMSNGIEEGSKVAETIAGWAQNPGFREEILQKAGVEIDNFKNKLSAQKQNRLNVFWTLKLSGREISYSQRLTNALVQVFEKDFADFNKNSAFPFGYSRPSIFTKKVIISPVIKIIASLFASGFFTVIFFFFWGSWNGRLLFGQTVRDIFPKTPTIKLSKKLGKHDQKLLQHFLNTFQNPKLISTFSAAENHFSIESIEKINIENESPILLIRIWDTKVEDIENMRAILGEDIGIIFFER